MMIDVKGKIIAIDFDGTCVTHEYPEVGQDVGAVPVLKKFIAEGARLILWTMRHDQVLEDAVNWFKENDIPLFGVNHNPEQDSWTNSPKAYAQYYIDDAAVGCPLCYDTNFARPFVSWATIAEMFFDERIK